MRFRKGETAYFFDEWLWKTTKVTLQMYLDEDEEWVCIDDFGHKYYVRDEELGRTEREVELGL